MQLVKMLYQQILDLQLHCFYLWRNNYLLYLKAQPPQYKWLQLIKPAHQKPEQGSQNQDVF